MKTYGLYFVLLYLSTIPFQGCKTSRQVSIPQNFPDFYQEGHRGARGLMPENTIAGMKKAIDEGANVIEVDVFTSKDQKVIVTHDAFINPAFSLTPDGKEIPEEDKKRYAVHQMNYEDIRKFDIGTKGNTAFPQQGKMPACIPLLGELIDEVEAYTSREELPKIIYNIELKTNKNYDRLYNAAPEELVDQVLAVVKSKKIDNRFYIQSFDVRPLQYIHKKYSDIVVGYLVSGSDTFEQNIQQLGFVPHIYSPHYKLVTPEIIDQCRQGGCKIVPWTVNTKEEMKGLIQMGVDGIITDYPNYLSEIVVKP